MTWNAADSEFVYEFKSKSSNSAKGYVVKFWSETYKSKVLDDNNPHAEYWVAKVEIFTKSGQRFVTILKDFDKQLFKYSKKENAEAKAISVICELLDT